MAVIFEKFHESGKQKERRRNRQIESSSKRNDFRSWRCTYLDEDKDEPAHIHTPNRGWGSKESKSKACQRSCFILSLFIYFLFIIHYIRCEMQWNFAKICENFVFQIFLMFVTPSQSKSRSHGTSKMKLKKILIHSIKAKRNVLHDINLDDHLNRKSIWQCWYLSQLALNDAAKERFDYPAHLDASDFEKCLLLVTYICYVIPTCFHQLYSWFKLILNHFMACPKAIITKIIFYRIDKEKTSLADECSELSAEVNILTRTKVRSLIPVYCEKIFF